MHRLHQTFHRLRNCFGRTQWNSLVTWVMWNLISVHLDTVLCQCKIGARFVPNIPQARKSFWTQHIELLGDVGHVESHFGLFDDSV